MKKISLLVGHIIKLSLIALVVAGLLGDFSKGLFFSIFIFITYQALKSINSPSTTDNELLTKPSILSTAVLLAFVYAISFILYLVLTWVIQYNPCSPHSWGYSERACASSVIEHKFFLSN